MLPRKYALSSKTSLLAFVLTMLLVLAGPVASAAENHQHNQPAWKFDLRLLGFESTGHRNNMRDPGSDAAICISQGQVIVGFESANDLPEPQSEAGAKPFLIHLISLNSADGRLSSERFWASSSPRFSLAGTASGNVILLIVGHTVDSEESWPSRVLLLSPELHVLAQKDLSEPQTYWTMALSPSGRSLVLTGEQGNGLYRHQLLNIDSLEMQKEWVDQASLNGGVSDSYALDYSLGALQKSLFSESWTTAPLKVIGRVSPLDDSSIAVTEPEKATVHIMTMAGEEAQAWPLVNQNDAVPVSPVELATSRDSKRLAMAVFYRQKDSEVRQLVYVLDPLAREPISVIGMDSGAPRDPAIGLSTTGESFAVLSRGRVLMFKLPTSATLVATQGAGDGN